MGMFAREGFDEECDICGAKLDPEDLSVHLCKFCQEEQFKEK